jgi:hypothetical protein
VGTSQDQYFFADVDEFTDNRLHRGIGIGERGAGLYVSDIRHSDFFVPVIERIKLVADCVRCSRIRFVKYIPPFFATSEDNDFHLVEVGEIFFVN